LFSEAVIENKIFRSTSWLHEFEYITKTIWQMKLALVRSEFFFDLEKEEKVEDGCFTFSWIKGGWLHGLGRI